MFKKILGAAAALCLTATFAAAVPPVPIEGSEVRAVKGIPLPLSEYLIPLHGHLLEGACGEDGVRQLIREAFPDMVLDMLSEYAVCLHWVEIVNDGREKFTDRDNVGAGAVLLLPNMGFANSLRDEEVFAQAVSAAKAFAAGDTNVSYKVDPEATAALQSELQQVEVEASADTSPEELRQQVAQIVQTYLATEGSLTAIVDAELAKLWLELHKQGVWEERETLAGWVAGVSKDIEVLNARVTAVEKVVIQQGVTLRAEQNLTAALAKRMAEFDGQVADLPEMKEDLAETTGLAQQTAMSLVALQSVLTVDQQKAYASALAKLQSQYQVTPASAEAN